MKEGSAQQVLYNSALTLMTFTLTTWNLDVYNELELRPTLHILFRDLYQCWTVVVDSQHQGGITCGAIDEPRKSSKAIDERVIINFRDKNGVIARFRDKNVVIVRFCDKNVECLYIYYGVIEE